MILKIEIPEEFIEHFGNDKFNDSLGRICYDIESVFKTGSGVSGRYEWELVEMLADAFDKSKDYDHANERMERRIRRLTWCVESWKKANADLQRTNSRLRKAISLNSLKEIEYMSAENADLKKKVKELEVVISKMETTQKWISVEDVLPQWEKLVKIKFKDGKEDERRFSADYKWVSKGMQTCESVNVTHWMPLPPPPTTEEK